MSSYPVTSGQTDLLGTCGTHFHPTMCFQQLSKFLHFPESVVKFKNQKQQMLMTKKNTTCLKCCYCTVLIFCYSVVHRSSYVGSCTIISCVVINQKKKVLKCVLNWEKQVWNATPVFRESRQGWQYVKCCTW